ncbi:MAG: hypothetical protein K2L80_01390, partial [Muribaculaceae bacterium]|nr:hypothetical protein [Muribaculaceae bacterium]
TEQGIEANMVKSFFDSDGLFQGELRYKKESSIASENNNKQDKTPAADPSDNDLHTDDLHEQSDDDIYYDTEDDNEYDDEEDEGACTIEDFFKNNLDQKISFHVLMKEVEIMQAKLNNLTRQEEQTCKSLRDIMYSLDRSIITESNKTNRKFSIADYKFHIIELVMTAILSLIAGVTLGALIFLEP